MQKDSAGESTYLIVACVLMYGILLAHTYILYPFLPAATLCYQALLRLLVAIAPLIITTLLLRTSHYKRYMLWMSWALFIPYPLYNFFQLRHIAELWRIPAHSYFTDPSYNILLWQMIPVCVYSISQLFVFFYCLQMAASSIGDRGMRIAFETGVLAYTSMAVVIGLSSRLDTFHIITRPMATAYSIRHTVTSSAQLLNIASVFCMAAILYLAWRGAMDRIVMHKK